MKFISSGIVLAVVLMLCSMLVIGCVQSPGAAANDSGNGTKITDKVNSSIADNKTAYDKNQTAIAKVIADGLYEANKTYRYHSGEVSVLFKVSVKDDVITEASATGNNADNVSTMIIGKFNRALPDLVVGKKINELSIPKNVAGSSLTTAAFKAYVGELAGTAQ